MVLLDQKDRMLNETYLDVLKYDIPIKNCRDRKTRRASEKYDLIKKIKGQALADDIGEFKNHRKEKIDQITMNEKMKRLAGESFTCEDDPSDVSLMS